MAENIKIKLDASKFDGAFRHNIQGRESSKECLCIPIENFFQGKDGALYIDFTGYDANGRYGKLYSIKQSIGSERYKALTPEQRRAIPFCGDIKSAAQAPAEVKAFVSDFNKAVAEDNDLPF